MSNKVGELYNTVIESVIRETKTEFEDTGDDPAVLDMLMKAWRKRLGEMNVIKDPGWDAQARRDDRSGSAGWDADTRGVDGLAAAGVPPVPGAPRPPPGVMPGGPTAGDSMPMASDGLLFGLPPVKQEPGDMSLPGQGPPPPPPQHTPTPGQGSTTQSPASQHPLYVRDQPFDLLASSDRSGLGYNPLSSGAGTDSPASRQHPQPQQQQQQQQPPPPPPAAQQQHPQHPQQPGLQQLPRGASLSPELQRQLNDAMNGQSRVPQTDGPVDEELNSDLDDSEDELIDSNDDEEGEQTQIMLCLYEKVHKVKTRWKYTLKDGVANVNGLDYVFARANGESEW